VEKSNGDRKAEEQMKVRFENFDVQARGAAIQL